MIVHIVPRLATRSTSCCVNNLQAALRPSMIESSSSLTTTASRATPAEAPSIPGQSVCHCHSATQNHVWVASLFVDVGRNETYDDASQSVVRLLLCRVTDEFQSCVVELSTWTAPLWSAYVSVSSHSRSMASLSPYVATHSTSLSRAFTAFCWGGAAPVKLLSKAPGSAVGVGVRGLFQNF